MSEHQRRESPCPHCGAYDTEGPCFGEGAREYWERELAEASAKYRKDWSEWAYGTPSQRQSTETKGE